MAVPEVLLNSLHWEVSSGVHHSVDLGARWNHGAEAWIVAASVVSDEGNHMASATSERSCAAGGICHAARVSGMVDQSLSGHLGRGSSE